MQKRLALILLLLSFSFEICSQEVLTLDTAVSIALNNNYTIMIARNELEIAENNSSVGAAGLFPRLDADASFIKSQTDSDQEYFDRPRVTRDNAVAENFSAGVSLNWTVFDGLRMFASLDRLKTLRDTERTRLKLEIENNISGVIRYYYDIVRLYGRLEVLQNTLAISEERLRLTESKKEVGSASKFEVLQAMVDLNEDRSSYYSEQLALSDAKSNLNILLGRDPSTDFIIEDTIMIHSSLNFDDLQTLLNSENAELKIAEQNVNLASIDINLANSSWFPRIDLTAGYDYIKSESQSGLLKSNKTSGFNYGILAFFNLFNGFNTRLQSENARILFESNKIQFSDIQNRVHSELFNTYRRYEISLDIVKLENENYKAAEENVAIALERLRLGSITPLEFRETQIDLINAQNRLVNAQYEAKTAETHLLRLTGQLVKESD